MSVYVCVSKGSLIVVYNTLCIEGGKQVKKKQKKNTEVLLQAWLRKVWNMNRVLVKLYPCAVAS